MIRPYTTEDTDRVLAVWEASTRVAHPFMTEEFLAAERANLREIYLPHTETWIAETPEGVIGFIALIHSEGAACEIGGLFVEPERQRGGIGTALLAKARELKGELEVEVFETNPLGRAFYDKHGFAHLSRSTHEPTGQAVLRLRLTA